MNITRKITFGAAAAVAVVGGLSAGAGLQTAIGAKDDTSTAFSETEVKWAEPLPPNEKLGNGKEAGLFRSDTPLEERPEYWAAQLADGTPGYLKLSDINDGFVAPPHKPGEVVDVTKELRAAEKRAKELMVQPNEKGEIWAPLYGKDGETVLGHVLIDPGAPID